MWFHRQLIECNSCHFCYSSVISRVYLKASWAAISGYTLLYASSGSLLTQQHSDMDSNAELAA